jgi:hypothetical protein
MHPEVLNVTLSLVPAPAECPDPGPVSEVAALRSEVAQLRAEIASIWEGMRRTAAMAGLPPPAAPPARRASRQPRPAPRAAS